MSGIFGIIDPRLQSKTSSISGKMASALSHLPWYVVDRFADDNLGLAFGRTGINIFNRNQQPVWNASHTIALVMAGELYKRNELEQNDPSKSDEEMALALYESLGENFVARLNGVFIIGIYDKRNNRFLIANDRFGMYPLFYSCLTGRLIFAPEMKGILCDDTFPRRIDLTALAQYVRFQHLLGERTFFEDIQLLSVASILTYEIATGSCSIRTYWSVGDIPYHPRVSLDEAVEETGMLLRRAVNRLSDGSCIPGVYLSGGLDSRAILGMLERRPVSSLTYGSRNCRDVFYAEKIARAAGSDHNWIDFPNGKWVEQYIDLHLELTEGFHSWIHAHGISTLSRARELMEVNLTGFGGGMLKGLPGNLEPIQAAGDGNTTLITRFFNEFNQKYTWPSIDEAEENLLYSEAISGQMQGLAFESFRAELVPYLDCRADVRGEYFYLNNHDRRLIHNYVTFTRSHIEVRMPFYDYDLFEFIHSVPAEYRVSGNLYRRIIQRETPKLAYIPYDHDQFLPTTSQVIRSVHALGIRVQRRINRHVVKIFPEMHTLYADYENYLRSELREWAENILFDRRTVKREIFNPALLRSLMSRHLSKLEHHTIGKIAPLITYEMMLRRYYDQSN